MASKKTKNEIPTPTSRFLEVECRKCKKRHVIFSKVATLVECDKCGECLATPRGGTAWIKAKVLNVLD
jgi:ribosomal protein S27E